MIQKGYWVKILDFFTDYSGKRFTEGCLSQKSISEFMKNPVVRKDQELIGKVTATRWTEESFFVHIEFASGVDPKNFMNKTTELFWEFVPYGMVKSSRLRSPRVNALCEPSIKSTKKRGKYGFAQAA